MLGALKEKGRRRGEGESTPGSGGGRRGRGGAAPEVGDDPDRWAPPVSGVRVRGELAGRLGVSGPRWFGPRGGKKEKKDRWARWAGKRVGLFVCFFSFFSIPFLSFSFQTLTQNLFKIFKQIFDHTTNQNPCIHMMHKHLVSLN
jgi:hypothetical protein